MWEVSLCVVLNINGEFVLALGAKYYLMII
jgi:hypothetical protein